MKNPCTEKIAEAGRSPSPGKPRFYKEETKGDENFSRKLAEGADVYVNDAFGTAHRAHASTTIVANFFPNDKLFGYLIINELQAMDKVLKTAEKPFHRHHGRSQSFR